MSVDVEVPSPAVEDVAPIRRRTLRAAAVEVTPADNEPAPVQEAGPRVGSWNGRDRRSSDLIMRLTREFDSLCTLAVDAAEIAAGLESAGFTDGTAREYRCDNVFALAERMFQLAPRLVNSRPGRLSNPWAERPLRHLTRGVSFALPGLIFVACLPRVSTGVDFVFLTIAMLVGWPTGQVMAFVGHTLEGRRHPLAARGMLLVALCASIAMGLTFAGVAEMAGASRAAAFIGGGEIVYMAAAAVIFVFGHELLVLASMVPGLGAAAVGLWVPGAPPLVVGIGGAVTVLAAVTAACLVCVRVRPADVRIAFASLTGQDWTEAAFHLAYGICGGLLVSLPAVSGFGREVGTLSLLPVIWSMGFAEWNIVNLRRRSFDLLNEAISVDFFQSQVRQLVAQSVSRYSTALTLLTALLIAGAWLLFGVSLTSGVIVGLASSWFLGCSFYLALVLSSLGRIRVVVIGMVAALCLGWAVIQFLEWSITLLIAPLLLSLLLFPALRLTIGDPTRHM